MEKQLVLIPVYNEEDTIEAVMDELCRHYSGHVLLVDDGSTDRSMERVKQCGRWKLSTIVHQTNLGYGAALRDGFQFASENGYEVVVTMDCDCQHEPKQVPEFFERIGSLDVLSGSRYLETQASDNNAPEDRKAINAQVTARINNLTGFNLTDAFCGFKAYRVGALSKFELTESGYGMPLQFWIQARHFNLQVGEIPVARIYQNLNRSFGAVLDDPDKRLRYYEEIIGREADKWRVTSMQ